MISIPEQPPSVETDPRWQQLLRRDSAASFVYAVQTTGIYCRVGCSARRPLARNVEFFDTAAAAERAGYRACLRCRPGSATTDAAERVRAMCLALDEAGGSVTLRDLARGVHLSPSQAHRTFVECTGITPRAYGKSLQRQRVMEELRAKPHVTDAIYAAGFSAPSRFYENAAQTLGMTPKRFSAGGAGITIRYAICACSLGRVLVAMTDQGVCSVLLGDDDSELSADLSRRFPRAAIVLVPASEVELVDRVVAHVDRDAGTGVFDLPLDVQGTVFQHRVWQALCKIPAGTTLSYEELARAVGTPKGSRAVASACAANPVAVLIPCHRVLHKNGTISGYRWGVERKRQLLDREQAGADSATRGLG